MLKGEINRGPPTITLIHMDIKAITQTETIFNMMGIDLTTILVGQIILIGAPSQNAKFVPNWAILLSFVLNITRRMPLPIVQQLLLERTKPGCLIQLPLIISRVIFPIYLFILNMMGLMK